MYLRTLSAYPGPRTTLRGMGFYSPQRRPLRGATAPAGKLSGYLMGVRMSFGLPVGVRHAARSLGQDDEDTGDLPLDTGNIPSANIIYTPENINLPLTSSASGTTSEGLGPVTSIYGTDTNFSLPAVSNSMVPPSGVTPAATQAAQIAAANAANALSPTYETVSGVSTGTIFLLGAGVLVLAMLGSGKKKRR